MTAIDATSAETTVAPLKRPRSSRRMGHLARRAGLYLLTAVAACTLNFVIPRFMPGDPVDALVQKIERQTGAAVSPEQIESYRAFFGDPTANLAEQFIAYWARLLQFDFGVSTTFYPVPVADIIGQALPWTLFLAGTSVIVSFLLGITIGAVVGMRPGRLADTVLLPGAAFAGALPPFWVAMLLIYFVAFQTGLFPIAGSYSSAVDAGFTLPFLGSALHYALLPVVATVSASVGFWILQMRNMTVTTVTEDYVLLAEAKGLSRARVIVRYAARNALLPPVTNLATAFGGIVGGLLFTELVFNYPGVGSVLVQAVGTKDFPVMQGVFLMVTLAILLGNFLADSLYVILDPRTRSAR